MTNPIKYKYLWLFWGTSFHTVLNNILIHRFKPRHLNMFLYSLVKIFEIELLWASKKDSFNV